MCIAHTQVYKWVSELLLKKCQESNFFSYCEFIFLLLNTNFHSFHYFNQITNFSTQHNVISKYQNHKFNCQRISQTKINETTVVSTYYQKRNCLMSQENIQININRSIVIASKFRCCMSEWLLFNAKISKFFSAIISWSEQVIFRWDDDDDFCFVLDQHP